MARRYWLMKTEPDVFSLADLKARPAQTEPWEGVRNYQARNLMRDAMHVGDRVLFYHSSTEPTGVAGVAEIVRAAYPDTTALDPESPYFDAKATPEDPRWLRVDVRFVAEFPRFVTLAEMKAEPALAEMRVVQRGQRLSIQPVTAAEFKQVCAMGGWKGQAPS
ncbi:MAG: EVE domain-containing protein [Verrucomicrobiae bacterium]|nr:EVE domain-containing protein [Verrucomicrobiae bacterium]